MRGDGGALVFDRAKRESCNKQRKEVNNARVHGDSESAGTDPNEQARIGRVREVEGQRRKEVGAAAVEEVPEVVSGFEKELAEAERREEMAKAEAKKKAAETKKVEKAATKKIGGESV